MRRITILLMTVATLALVSTMFVGSVAGAHKHPTTGAHKHPTRTVSIQNFSFKPANITIKPGTKVIWINRDSTVHTATANNGRSFDSGRLGPGQRFSHTFRTAGKKSYHCELHSSMRGSVTVKR
jgi:plastocyanin